MEKITKTELNNLIIRYAVLTEEKKPLLKECNELSEEIKDAMAEREVTTFAAMGYVANVIFKKGRKLNMTRLEKLLTKEQIESCYDPTVTPTLTVTATAANSDTKPKVEKAGKAA